MASGLVVFGLFFVYAWIQKFFFTGSGDQGKKDYLKRYIKALQEQTLHFQANSSFVTKTLLEREIAKQEEILSTLRMYIYI